MDIRPFVPKYDPKAYIYTDGSLITWQPVLGAAITYPMKNLTIKIKVLSDPIRHTINRADLAAIALTLMKDEECTDISLQFHKRPT